MVHPLAPERLIGYTFGGQALNARTTDTRRAAGASVKKTKRYRDEHGHAITSDVSSMCGEQLNSR
jgi:hypothetical protein